MKRWSGGGYGGGGVAPDAHTPTPTNYHCVTGNEEEVKTEAAPAQMSRFVRFTPESVQTKRTTGQVTSNVPPPPLPPPSQQTLPLAPQRAPFGARMGPIIQGKVIHGGTLRWKSLQRVDICSTSQSALCLRRSPHLSAVRPGAGHPRHLGRPMARARPVCFLAGCCARGQ